MRSNFPFATVGYPTDEVLSPQSYFAEIFVLSCFMRHQALFERHPIEPDAFTRRDLREMYHAMTATGSTVATIFSQNLIDRGLFERLIIPGEMRKVAEFAVDADHHFPRHLAELLDRHTRRKAVATCRLALAKIRDCTDPDGLAAAIALLHSIKGSAPAAQSAFGLMPVHEIQTEEPARDFVEGLFLEGGASVVYGESNVGKSFWVLDIAAHVAMGRPWRKEQREVDRGAVVYVALEGTHGLRQRIQAMKQTGVLSEDAPLYICFSPVSLLDPDHAAKLIETVKAAAEKSGLPCRLVIIDTLARAMAGGDENSSRDMTAAVAAIDAVRAASGAHVCIVHHCGKDIARGARGHSSLRAAVDTEIEIFRPEGERISTVRVTKQRDLERGEPMPFSLTIVTLGPSHRGKPITSCIVTHEDETMASSRKPGARKTTYTAEALLDYLPAAGIPDWATRAKEDCGIGSTRFYELKAELKIRGAYRADPESGKLVRI
ncbi:helicase RepA family protein [Luteolibacter soli]|uniref:Helicase RepA family protein n=1 Tax=Luteolibacter soli TaxID=3135280 RepID=A0ABU9B3L8_9BACT